MNTLRRSLLAAGAGCLLGSVASGTQPTPVTVIVTLDTTQAKTSIPAKFLGAMDASNIGPGYWDQTRNNYLDPNTGIYTYNEWLNLLSQMQIKYWRVAGGESQTQTAINQFFTGISIIGTSGPSVEWGMPVYNVDKIGLFSSCSFIWGNATNNGLLDAFNFGNESDFQDNVEMDQFIKNKARNGPSGYTDHSWTGPITSYNQADNTTADPTMPAPSNPDPGSKSGFKFRWEYLHDQLMSIAPAGTRIMGPDTGTKTTVADPTGSVSAIVFSDGSTSPWTLQFAHDEYAAKSPTKYVDQISQHLYSVDGDYTGLWDKDNGVPTALGTWAAGKPFCVGDQVWYNGKLYRCSQNIVATSGDTPDISTNWTTVEKAWSTSLAVYKGTVVTYGGNYYQWTGGTLSTGGSPNPSTDHGNHTADGTGWVQVKKGDYAFPGAHQLAKDGFDPALIDDWNQMYSHELAGAKQVNGDKWDWPSALTFRLTEFSPFSGHNPGVYEGSNWGDGTSTTGADPSKLITGTNGACKTNCFGSALLGLEQMHWWARKGCQGVCPITRPFKINSPVFQGSWGIMNSGPMEAEPWAYAWPAFNIGSRPGSGQSLWSSNGGIALQHDQDASSNPNVFNNVTAYAVLDPTTNHLTVTIFNKTFAYSNGQGSLTWMDIPVTIKMKPNVTGNFVPAHIRKMALASGASGGDSTAMGATLGGQTMSPANSAFPEASAWTTVGNWNSSYTVTVPAFSAMIVDLY